MSAVLHYRNQAPEHERLRFHLLYQDSFDHRRDVRTRRGVGFDQYLLFTQYDFIAYLDNPGLVDTRHPHVLVDFLVYFPHLRGLGNVIVAANGIQQDVELGCLWLHHRIRVKGKADPLPLPVAHAGQVGKCRLVGNPDLLQHRAGHDFIQQGQDFRRPVACLLGGRNDMRSNTGLRNHLVVKGRIERFRHVSQGNLADFRKLGREQLHRLDRGDLHFLLQRMCASVQHRGGDGDHRNAQQGGHHQEHAHGQSHAGLLPGMVRGGHG